MSQKAKHQPLRGLAVDKDNGWIFGVCAGLANFSGLDPALVRVGAAIGALFMPKIVIAGYLLAWLLLDDRRVWQKR